MPSTEDVVCLAVVLIALGFAIQYLLNPYLHKLGVRRSEEDRTRKISEEEERKFREEIWKMADEKRRKK